MRFSSAGFSRPGLVDFGASPGVSLGADFSRLRVSGICRLYPFGLLAGFCVEVRYVELCS